ncbi:MAG: hypothetical protein EBY17_29125 [Acidobacteriia bacterium]|nr:hypothetical protein [Terriglobia bacterium]
MRTTLTLDPDVALYVKEQLAGSSRTLKEVVNETMRRGLAVSPPAPPPQFTIETFALHLPAEIGYGKLNQYYDDLEMDDYLAKRNRDELAWQAEQLKSASEC